MKQQNGVPTMGRRVPKISKIAVHNVKIHYEFQYCHKIQIGVGFQVLINTIFFLILDLNKIFRYSMFYLFFQILGILCMACCGPAYFSTQHWFLLVVVLGFLGSLFFSLYYLCLDVYLKGFNINWLQSVTIGNNKKFFTFVL